VSCLDEVMMFYTYVIISERDRKFYIGFTKDIEKRLAEHNDGLVTSTEYRRPLKLVYYEACLNERDAIKREKYFKSGYGRRFLNNRIETFLKEFN
jgi:putative endonuclease